MPFVDGLNMRITNPRWRKNRKIATKFGSRRLTIVTIPTVKFQTGSKRRMMQLRIEK